MSEPLEGEKKEQAENHYDTLINVMLQKNLPFMIGGTFAFNQYTGLDRPTGDIDIMTAKEDYPRILKELSDAGYKTELTDSKWLAKVWVDDFYIDIIFADRNGLFDIEKSWYSLARQGTILDHQVKLQPVEEMIKSKCYIRNRDRDDTGDVVHLILKQGRSIQWEYIYKKMKPHWELLASIILMFMFIYPSEREAIPKWLIEKLLIDQVQDRIAHPPTKNRITRGLLLSTDYDIGVSQWGFKPIQEMK